MTIHLKKLGSNKTELQSNGRTVFYSYSTPVVVYTDWSENGDMPKVYVTEKKFSVTTSKHINQYLSELPSRWERFNVPQETLETLV
jgi:hypothetical protein